MGYEYNMLRDDELMHYGVKGMKWGVRRDLEALRTANASGSKGGHNTAVANLSTHRDKINKKISSLDAKNAKLETKRAELAKTKDSKLAEYETKAAKYRYKANKTLWGPKERRLETKARKMDLKAKKLNEIDIKMRNKIENNEKLKKTFNMGLDEINKELVDNGQDFLYMKPNGFPYTAADYD